MLTSQPEITKAYEKFQQSREELVALLKDKASMPIEKDYTLLHDGKEVQLADVFGERNDLLVIHNMGRQCRWCTLWADGLNGLLSHLEARTNVVLVGPDDPAVQREFAESRNWNFRMLSDQSGAFTDDMGFAVNEEGKRYVLPGVSAFHRSEDGTITKTASDMFGPGDIYMPVYPLFELLKDGASTWEPQYKYEKPLSIQL